MIVRDYINDAIKSVRPRFKEWRDAFNYENIPANCLDNTYHLEFESVDSRLRDDQAFNDTYNVSVRIHKKCGKDNIDEFDELMGTATDIRKAIMSHVSLKASTNVYSATMDSITPEFFDTNDNKLRFTISFTVETIFKDTY